MWRGQVFNQGVKMPTSYIRVSGFDAWLLIPASCEEAVMAQVNRVLAPT